MDSMSRYETTAATAFAPAERAPKEEVLRQAESFLSDTLLCQLLDGIPEVVLILNKERQIVFSNKSLLTFLGVHERDSLCGFRPGEVLRCAHAEECEAGCGTTEFCGTCGAVTAILSSLHGNRDIQECRIIQKDSGEPMDLRVCATPFVHRDQRFTLFTVSDISHEKRREALERAFFHDILNTAGALMGYAELLQDGDPDDVSKHWEEVYRLAGMLISEIKAQKILSAAEKDELEVNPIVLSSLTILREGSSLYRQHEVARERKVQIVPNAEEFQFISDEVLVKRIIGNMIKNALEASQPGDTVTLGCRANEENVEFWVHNNSHMSRNTELQVFKRSFSTKGRGRGLGTYSMKLLGERYLKGKVSFTTSEDEGTTFTLRLPKSLEE